MGNLGFLAVIGRLGRGMMRSFLRLMVNWFGMVLGLRPRRERERCDDYRQGCYDRQLG